VQVGDLVKCIPADRRIGLIVCKRPNGPKRTPSSYRSFVYDVVVRGGIFPFLPSQLEVINASR